ncbi:unnamed protein product [Caenorhabditis angaria]|uniref:Protein kinase domain-containing protein n=1 Tax=Caenorhabditis angaria TaxID=860376 RepID=A0A9P1I6S0_9PELO|nr:unnamed protein product [Caenorhabditis angaria]
MSDFDVAFKFLLENPTMEVFIGFATQVEMMASRIPSDEMKSNILKVFTSILSDRKFHEIRVNEEVLRIYNLLAGCSQRLGATGVYEQIEKKGYFEKSLKFHLQWAEQYGKANNLEKFKHVLDLARDRLKSTMANNKIEAGFRDLADSYFKDDVDYLFLDPDNTMAIFDSRYIGKPKNRRRSSINMLRRGCPVVDPTKKNFFGPKTKSLLRSEFLDGENGFGTSPEEFRFALLNDVAGDEMDIEMDEETHIVPNNKTADFSIVKNENRRRQLSIVDEERNTSDEADSEKKSRIYSPIVATKDAIRVPLRNASFLNEKPPTTITLSSDTKLSAFDNESFGEIEKDNNEKLREMESGRKERTSSESEKSTRSQKSNVGLDILAENNCLEAHAAFSDTVHIGKERTMMHEEHTMMEDLKSLASTQNVTTDFSVYCDPDPTFVVHSNAVNSEDVPRGLNMRYDEQSPEHQEVLKPKPVVEVGAMDDASYNTPPSTKTTEKYWDDSLIVGFTPGNVITSTPAAHIPFVNVEDYFGNTQNIEKPQEERPQFVIPDATGILQNRLNRRKSTAPAKQVEVETKPTPFDESLSEQLGRRLSLGPEEMANKLVEAAPVEVEETGRKDRRRSEVIRQENNPWDENLRARIMRVVPTPTNMHEFETISPKILAMKSFEAGGETYDIRTLLGQGGYAKVYKAITEEKKMVAVKYEIPSCAWEVYICDQMRTRLLARNDLTTQIIANQCIMQVTDAYIFSNASLLVNEYHEFGSLLDNINNSKDPNWHISCFLLVQLAKILEQVHECGIVHGDIKPDNFMITRKIDMGWEADKLMGTDVFVVKLIDWGRAIDMSRLKEREFKGRAGTEGFDCPEMIDGRGWTYQPDFFGYAATMTVLISGTYSKVVGSELGDYSLDVDIKRRNKLRDPAMEIVKDYLNIPSCSQLPKWSTAIDSFTNVWRENFDISAWRQAAAKFNEACEKSKK